MQVAAAPAAQRRAGPRPRNRTHLAPAASRARARRSSSPSSVGTGHGAAQRGLRERHVEPRHQVLAVALEARIRLDHHEHVEVARRAAAAARVALAGEPHALPVVDAGRDVDRQVARPRPRWPEPRHTPHGVCAMRPSPPQRSQACVRTTWPNTVRAIDCSWPVPSQRGQVSIGVPGSAPFPWQCEHGVRDLELDVLRRAGEHLLRASCETCTATSRPRSGPARPRRRRRRRTGLRRRRRTPRRCRRCCRSRPSSAASRPSAGRRARSGRRRRAARRSLSTSYASATSLNLFSASGSWRLMSGCSSRASRRNAFLISSSPASRETARTS